MDLDRIRTIVVVMMENRSFDHLLGYLALDPDRRSNLDGLKTDPAWREEFANPHGELKFFPHQLADPYHPIDADPPHERYAIANQMGAPVDGNFPMTGFVENYAGAKGASSLSLDNPPPVMGYFTAEEAPVTDFFAQNFAVCDHWFSSLPAGTQPNRLMAMSGFSNIDVNQVPLPRQELVYDWLNANGIRWRVYHEGMPFFALMPNWIDDVIGSGQFRPLERLSLDVDNEPPDEFPQVIFIEPTYTDCPHIGVATDDHAPSAIKGGQQFLLEVYRDMTRNPDVWASTVIIVTYDEHGGFFDHVSPPALRTDPPLGISYPAFETLGVRVPAFVISPFVEPKTVFNPVLDHTSILKFIGEKFGPGGRYSDIVDQRAVGSVQDVLNGTDLQRPAPAIPSLNDYLARESARVGFLPGTAPDTTLQHGFQSALNAIRARSGGAGRMFNELIDAFPERPPLTS